jgi:hypothetical protein
VNTWVSVTEMPLPTLSIIFLFIFPHGVKQSFYFRMGWNWVHLVLRPLFALLCQPMTFYEDDDNDDDCGKIDVMRTGKGNRSAWRKPAPVLYRPPQIPHELTQVRTRTAATNRLSYGMAPTLVMSQFCYEHRLSSLLRQITSRTCSERADIYFGGVEQFWYQLWLSLSDWTLQGIWDTSVISDRLHGVLLLSHSFNKGDTVVLYYDFDALYFAQNPSLLDNVKHCYLETR